MHHGSVFEDAGVNIGSNISITCLGSLREAEVGGRRLWAGRKMSGLLWGLLLALEKV